MKKGLLIVCIVIILLLSGCNSEFSFRNNAFEDSLEQVQLNERDDGRIRNIEGYQYLYDDLNVHDPYVSTVAYVFDDNGLYLITEYFSYFNMGIEDVYDSTKKSLLQYGSPDKEAKEDNIYKALWEKEGYNIVLLITDIGVIITYNMDKERAEKYYDSYKSDDLY